MEKATIAVFYATIQLNLLKEVFFGSIESKKGMVSAGIMSTAPIKTTIPPKKSSKFDENKD